MAGLDDWDRFDEPRSRSRRRGVSMTTVGILVLIMILILVALMMVPAERWTAKRNGVGTGAWPTLPIREGVDDWGPAAGPGEVDWKPEE